MRTWSTYAWCCHFPSEGDQRRDAAGPDAEGTNQGEGKDLRGRYLRKEGTPDRTSGGATRQPQQEQSQQREQDDREATLHSATIVAAADAARTADAVRATAAGGGGQLGKPGGGADGRGFAAARSRRPGRQRGPAGAGRGRSGAGTGRSSISGRGAAGGRGCASGWEHRGQTRQAGTRRVLRTAGPGDRAGQHWGYRSGNRA